jgi:hypothetical protein
MLLKRVIDPTANEEAIERIRLTFDEIVMAMNVPLDDLQTGKTPYISLPEELGAVVVKPSEGDIVYGLNEDGIETLAVYHSLGWALIARTGTFVYPDGLEEPEATGNDEDVYDHFYDQLDTFLRAVDMPDKITEPLDDEIDVEQGFGDADLDGEPLDPNDQ